MKKSVLVEWILKTIRLVVLFLPFIISFKSIRITELDYTEDLFLLFLNFLMFNLMNLFFTILIPRNYKSAKYVSYIYAVVFLIGQFISLVLPTPELEFDGVVKGVLNFQTFTAFLFMNFPILLYMFVVSMFLEYEIGGDV